MDGMTYLGQISTYRQQPKPNPLARIFSKKTLKYWIGGLVGVVVLIAGVMIYRVVSYDRGMDVARQADLRMTNLAETIATYGGSVKASNLRSITATLTATLTNTQRDLAYVLAEQTGAPDMTKMAEEEAEHIAEVNAALNQAVLSGRLDRTYLNQMTREVALLISLEEEAMEKSGNEALGAVLGAAVGDLRNIQTQLENYTSLAN